MFEAKKYFIKARREYIDEPLKDLGFQKYKTACIARLTDENVFQFLDFQKSSHGGQEFTINVAIRPLFSSKNDYLTLLPGNRLGQLAFGKDTWWSYSTEREGEKSFEEISKLITKYAIPFFDATKKSDDIIKSYEENIFGISKFRNKIGWGTIGWENYDFGHIYLNSGKNKKAIREFNKCYKVFGKDDNETCLSAAKQSKKVINLIKEGQTKIENYLRETIQESKDNLQLNDW